MRDYEVVYIFKSSLTTEEIEARLEGYHARILASDGSEITAVEHWGKRQLAYPIDRNDNGYYVVTQFTASPTVLPDYERVLKLDEDLMRHLVVLSEGELPVPAVADREEDRRSDRGRGEDVKEKKEDTAEGDGGEDAAEGEGSAAEEDGDDAAEDDAANDAAGDDASDDAAGDDASDDTADDAGDEEAGDDAADQEEDR